MSEPYGRAAPLRTLREALSAAADGRGSFVFLEGEGGIGKTALVDALVGRGARARDGRLPSRGSRRCSGTARSGSWSTRSASTAAAPVPGSSPALLLAEDESGGADEDGWPATQFRVEESLLSLLEDRTQVTPLLLVVEDLHWADPASVALLHRLAGAAAALPLLVLGDRAHQPPQSRARRCCWTIPPYAGSTWAPCSDDVVARLADRPARCDARAPPRLAPPGGRRQPALPARDAGRRPARRRAPPRRGDASSSTPDARCRRSTSPCSAGSGCCPATPSRCSGWRRCWGRSSR